MKCDSEHGSILGIPVCEKGSRGVKRMIEEIVRRSMTFADENPIFQSDGENSIRAVVLAVKQSEIGFGKQRQNCNFEASEWRRRTID